MKYIIVTGGVLSGLGKGITVSSMGKLLESRGLSVTAIKIDPYLNCDAGTMNPYQHGEVFVLDDGSEVDLDLGNYERFLDTSLTKDHNITTGKAYRAVIEKERRGDYLGQTVQIIPHITDEIRNMIKEAAEKSGVDVTLVELGGTVGDIESMPFLEAVRQLHIEIGHQNCMFVHITLVPVMSVVGEQKTKPTQHSVKELRAIGIRPDAIVCRAKSPLSKSIKEKISLFCDVPTTAVISAPDAQSIYRVPLILEEQGLTDFLLERLGVPSSSEDLKEWRAFLDRLENPESEVSVAIVGKYTHLKDSYISHFEALHHCGAFTKSKVNIRWVEAEDEKPGGTAIQLEGVDGVVVPGGFGKRGALGKIEAARYARENKIPFLGICLGFQLAVVEFCRNVLGLEGANSTEFNKNTPHPVVDILPEQKGVKNLGGTMRLGAQDVIVQEGSKAQMLYESTTISERHRHRYEINPDYIKQIEDSGLKFTGRSPDKIRMEIAELSDHPYFVASQFHPELKSRPARPAPLYVGLLKAILEGKK
ncbi:MAG: CTP synthase (glutamine hydrolyzing) [Thermoplasmata archaeon]|nr:MAG: CTP synthase (glutamine hydrolyzing) [Thermoplasmata archaeon]